MKVYVNFEDKRWKKYAIDFEKIATAAVLPVHKNAEVSITLTNDADIHKLNKKYRNIDKPTNVLSFELGDDVLLGDIYISLDTVLGEAESASISVAEHTAHMIVHGMLHLQGYDHLNDKEAVVMENKEIKILKTLGIKNPYADESAVCSDLECCPGSKTIAWLKRLLRPDGWAQYVLMAVCGGIAALGFAPFYVWWATIIGIGGAYLLTVRAVGCGGFWRTVGRIMPFSVVYAIVMFGWMVHSIYVVPELTAQFAIWTVPALFGIGLVGGIVFAIPFVVISRMRIESGVRAILFATVWTSVLWFREWGFTGFPWNPIANIALPCMPLANSMSLWGALGLSFVIVGLIAGLVEVLRKRTVKNCMIFISFVVLAVGGMVYGAHNMKLAENSDSVSPMIRVIQPATSQSQKVAYSRAAALQNAEHNLHNLVLLASANSAPDLIVFPETSYPFMIDDDNMPLARALNTNIIIGSNVYATGDIYNAMVIANPEGKIYDVYSKSHLVPFGEYRPFGDIIPTPGQLSRGEGARIVTINLNGREFKFAPAICYEVVFSDSLIPRNASVDAIINITNDTWFGTTPGTYQHLDMVRRYAIESGLPIIRANYSGVSAFVASDGHLVSFIPVGQAGYADGIVWGAHNTPYRRIGRDRMMIIILLVSCLGVLVARRR